MPKTHTEYEMMSIADTGPPLLKHSSRNGSPQVESACPRGNFLHTGMQYYRLMEQLFLQGGGSGPSANKLVERVPASRRVARTPSSTRFIFTTPFLRSTWRGIVRKLELESWGGQFPFWVRKLEPK